jgi:hypothetical protein
MSDDFPGTAAKYDQVSVFYGIAADLWSVEAITDGGDIEYKAFPGAGAEDRAKEYARRTYPGYEVTVGKWIPGNSHFEKTGSFLATYPDDSDLHLMPWQ